MADKEIEQQKKQAIADIKQQTKESLSDIKNEARSHTSSLKDLLKSSKQDIKDLTKESKEQIKEQVADSKQELKQQIKDSKSEIKDLAKESKQDLKDIAKAGKSELKQAASDANDQITSAGEEQAQALGDLAEIVAQEFQQTVEDAGAEFGDAVKQATEDIDKVAKEKVAEQAKQQAAQKQEKPETQQQGNVDLSIKLLNSILKEITILRKITEGSIKYDSKSGRYRGARGRYVSDEDVAGQKAQKVPSEEEKKRRGFFASMKDRFVPKKEKGKQGISSIGEGFKDVKESVSSLALNPLVIAGLLALLAPKEVLEFIKGFLGEALFGENANGFVQGFAAFVAAVATFKIAGTVMNIIKLVKGLFKIGNGILKLFNPYTIVLGSIALLGYSLWRGLQDRLRLENLKKKKAELEKKGEKLSDQEQKEYDDLLEKLEPAWSRTSGKETFGTGSAAVAAAKANRYAPGADADFARTVASYDFIKQNYDKVSKEDQKWADEQDKYFNESAPETKQMWARKLSKDVKDLTARDSLLAEALGRRDQKALPEMEEKIKKERASLPPLAEEKPPSAASAPPMAAAPAQQQTGQQAPSAPASSGVGSAASQSVEPSSAESTQPSIPIAPTPSQGSTINEMSQRVEDGYDSASPQNSVMSQSSTDIAQPKQANILTSIPPIFMDRSDFIRYEKFAAAV